MIKVNYLNTFDLMLAELVADNPDIDFLVKERIKVFRKSPNDSRLRNHQLTKRMKGKWAFSITDDVRIVYKWTNKRTAEFLVIGTHRKVYRKS